MSERGSRWESSVTTFGPFGRLACTAGLVIVLLWFAWSGFLAFGGAVVWGVFVMPWALRDIWKRAELPSTDLTRLRDETAWQAREAQHALPEEPRRGVTRW